MNNQIAAGIFARPGATGRLGIERGWFELRLADLAHVVAFWACIIGLGAILVAW